MREAQKIGYWLDETTKLTWTAKDNGSPVNWQEAKQWCEGLRLGSFSDWRLPSIDELKGIYDSSSRKIRAPLTLRGSILWSGTRQANQSNPTAITLNITWDMVADFNLEPNGGLWALCVRGGPATK